MMRNLSKSAGTAGEVDFAYDENGNLVLLSIDIMYDGRLGLYYFGARYLDPMLGVWTSVDPARQFASPYLYAGNGMNPIGAIDPDGNKNIKLAFYYNQDEHGANFDAQKKATEYEQYISSRIDMSVNTVQVKPFPEGETTALEMTSWLNLGQPDLAAIASLTTKTYLGSCFAKDNLASGKYENLYGPEKSGKTSIMQTVNYLIENADVAPEMNQEAK
ncbi:MAG: hypothetical protein J5615_03330 [Fibrobacter sp.]|nr:hypothetical protein [Fibrobacter sp.]